MGFIFDRALRSLSIKNHYSSIEYNSVTSSSEQHSRSLLIMNLLAILLRSGPMNIDNDSETFEIKALALDGVMDL